VRQAELRVGQQPGGKGLGARDAGIGARQLQIWVARHGQHGYRGHVQRLGRIECV